MSTTTNVEALDFDNFVASFAEDAANKVYRNGYAVFLYSKGTSKKEGMKYAASVLDECFMLKDSRYVSNKLAIYRSMKTIESKLLNLKKTLVNWNNNKIQNFLLQPLKAPVSKKKQPLPSTSSVDVTVSGKQDECFFPQEAQMDRTPGTQDSFLPQVSPQQLEAPLKKLRTDCKQCNVIRKRFVTRCRFLEEKVRRVKLNAKSLCRSPEMKVWTQSLKRKTVRIETLKREKTTLKTRVRHLEQLLGTSATQMEKTSLLSRRNRILQKKVTKLQEEVYQLKATVKTTTEY